MEKDLKWIKKHYGEEMMHLCRDLFPRILETEGLLPSLLEKHFYQSRNLANDINAQELQNEFKDYIYSLIDVESEEIKNIEEKTAVELMSDAGYILYPECKTEEEIQSFKKWWKSGEELCTFRGGRLNSCRVWFAVKKDAGEINREEFTSPKRQDKYGTSVISIQFTKNKNQYLSIKNRYNHSVNNPDNTFNNKLDNIIPGLSDAFERDYGVRDRGYRNKDTFELSNYVCVDGKFYHYNYEINNIYYCDGNIIIDNSEVKKLPLHQMIVDYFIVDFNKKTISLYDKKISDSFCEQIGEIKYMSFNDGILKVFVENGEPIEIGLSSRNEIISYKNKNLINVDYDFLVRNKKLQNLDISNVQSIGDRFLYYNEQLSELDMPSLQVVGNYFIGSNEKLSRLNTPSLQVVGNGFLFGNEQLSELNMPNLQNIGDKFLYYNEQLSELDMPSLQVVGNYFLCMNEQLSELNMPSLQRVGNGFLYHNEQLSELNMPSLQVVGDDFLANNKKLENFSSEHNIQIIKE